MNTYPSFFKLLFASLGVLMLCMLNVQSQTFSFNKNYYQSNSISDILRIGNQVYVAGSFSAASRPYVSGVIVNATTGAITGPLVGPTSGAILSSVSDDAGGWYVGGSFTQLSDGSTRNRLMHILADQTVDPAFAPDVNDNVNQLVKSGNTLILAGDFTSINSVTRNRLASIDLTTNQLTTWDPNPNSNVNTLLLDGTTLYVGGTFTNIAGVSRSNVTSFDVTSGAVSSLSIPTNNAVNTLAINGNILYVGGSFTNILSTSRNRLAAVDLTNTTLTSFSFNINSAVTALARSGNSLFVAGQFGSINSTQYLRFAEIDLATTTLTNFKPSPSPGPRTLLVNGNDLYIGGFISTVQTSIPRSGVAVYEISTKTLKSLDVGASNVYTVSVSGSHTFVGGDFNGAGSIARQGLYECDALTGEMSSWNPGIGLGGACHALEQYGNNLFVAGNFTQVASTPRSHLCAFDLTTKALTSFDVSINNYILSMKLVGNILYIGGNFSSVGGQPRNGAAAIDLTTNTVTSWNPMLNSNVFVTGIEEHNGKIWICGPNLRNVNGVARNGIAVVNASDGSLDLTYGGLGNTNGEVTCMTKYNGFMYVGGQFSEFFGQPRTNLVAVSLTTGALSSFAVMPNGNVSALRVQNNHLLIGGGFTSILGANRSRFAMLRMTDLTLEPGLPIEPTGGVTAISLSDDKLFLGGTFQKIGLFQQAAFAGYDIDCSALPTPTITAAGPTSFCDGDEVILSGPAGYSYAWSNGATTQQITVSAAGTYSLQLTSGICTSAVSNVINVSLLPCRLKRYSGTGNWTDLSNWSGNSLPLAADTVVVMPGANLTMNTTATIRSIRVMNTAILAMTPLSDLTVTSLAHNLGTVTNVYGITGSLKLGGSGTAEILGNKWSANKVILLSNAKANADLDVWSTLDLNGFAFNANTRNLALRFGGPSAVSAQLLQPAGSAISNANNFRVDVRYPTSLSTTGTNGGAWILVGAPVGNQNVNTWSQGNFYAFSWQNGIYNGGSIYTYDPFYTLPLSKGYKKPTGATQAAPIGLGHRVWFRYNEFFLGPNLGGQSYIGTPHIGPFSWNLQYCVSGCADTLLPNTNTGYNMISNPFAATIDWDAPTGWTRNNVYNAMYIHKSLTQNVASYVNGVGNNGGSRYLPVGQGFFVWADAPGANMTATPAVIAPGQQVAHLRTGQTADVLRFNISFNNGIADEAVIRFDQRATPLFDDQLEARKMSNFSGLNFAFLNQANERIAINAESLPTAQTTYPLSLAVPRTGNYTIDFNGMATLTNNWSVFLKDNDLNTLIPVQDGQAYSFNQSAGSTTRFSLVIMPQGPTSLGNQVKLALNIVPNPGRDVVRVNLSQTTNGLITVTNQIGQVVMSEMVNGTSHELNVSKLAKGIYHVAVGGVVTKLVVE